MILKLKTSNLEEWRLLKIWFLFVTHDMPVSKFKMNYCSTILVLTRLIIPAIFEKLRSLNRQSFSFHDFGLIWQWLKGNSNPTEINKPKVTNHLTKQKNKAYRRMRNLRKKNVNKTKDLTGHVHIQSFDQPLL